jgi:superfamily II DNA or RNA helicase
MKNIAVPQAVEQETALITASVKGTSRLNYQVHVLFQANGGIWTLKTGCTCPVKFRCKHAAALLTLVTADLTKSGKVGNPVHAQQLPVDLHTWLGTIEMAAQASTAPPIVLPETRFLAYCIERPIYQSEPCLNFVLRVGTHQKDGSIKISQSRANADLSKPPKYMTSEDLLIISLYHQRNKKMSLWNIVPFKGPDWEDIIKAALESGRLFYGEESYDNSNFMEDYQQIQAGPGIPVDATWKISGDGSARPILQCENSALEIIFTHPPRYLDLDTATLGLLESNLPGSLLTAWQSGPAVSASNLMAVSERFGAISTAALPLPQILETVTVPKSPPLPHLRVHSRTLGSRWDTYKLVVGELSFRYADSPLLLPLAKGQVESHSQIINGKRLIWNRSLKAEQAQARRLIKVGFVALSEVISPQVLDPAALYSCVPAQFVQHPEIAWIELLESAEMQALRDSGWTIEVDANAGLTTHNITEFLPAIETHQDRDIDWFSFDISFEINGQFMSLIPIIAEGIRQDLPPADTPNLPEFITLPCENPEDGLIRFPTLRLLEIIDQTRHLFHGHFKDGPIRLDRLAAAAVADTLALDSSETIRALAKLGHCLKNITALPPAEIPASVRAELRPYQQEGYRWLQFLAAHGLHGILADDMGLGKTVQTLAHLAAECGKNPGLPSLVIAPTSVLPNWASEAEKFTPHLKVVALQGKDRAADFNKIATADVVLTSYPLLTRDFEKLGKQDWHLVALDEAQYIKNPKALSAQNAFKLKARHRICLSGTPMENHLGELWSLMRFLMPGFLADEKTFNTQLRRPIERDHSHDAQLALNRRISPLILRRTKDQVATELPPKTEIIHGIDLTKKQTDLYESVRAAMDKRVRDAIADKGLAKSHIIVLDALLKLRQICCHPALLKTPAAQKVAESAKLNFLTTELLPTLIEEGRRILLFSTFTSMLALIEEHLKTEGIAYLKLTGQTLDRASLVKKFQTGEVPVFLISLKAGGTGLNLTAADTVIHYDPWWNPAAENQATDRAHRIGQTKPVFVHKLVCRGTIEDRILDLQKHKSALVEALLSEETSKLKIDAETLSHLLAPLD